MNIETSHSNTPDPPQQPAANSMSPSHALRPIRTAITRNDAGDAAQKGSSPYDRKVLARLENDVNKVRAGIGGPAKRRESMSGIGNNLRSNNHAGLGRAVGRSVPMDQTPSGLTNLLRQNSARRASAYIDSDLPFDSDPAEVLPHMQRRGSSNTSSTVTANASSHTAGQTVFPTNPGFTFGTQQPQRRRTMASSQHLRPGESGMSPQSYRHPLNASSSSPAPLVRVHTISSSGAYQFARARNRSTASPARPQNITAENRTGSRATRDYGPRSYGTPESINMTIGSPNTGEIVDVVGSYSRPSVVYAAKRRPSKIGGAEEGKVAMQEKVGLGGKRGKDWMADRPSNLGAPAPRRGHPESGLSKLFKAFNIGSKNKDRPNEPSSPRSS
ncbi:hypothetical protein GGH96_000979 [Coemansia sp. RSA 1972]|nr:hypothetical protein GGH96_000979 [Coemansia sp. RSA 1972]